MRRWLLDTSVVSELRTPKCDLAVKAWADDTLRPWFAERTLGIDEDVLVTWRRMVERGRAANYTFSQPDLFIAATAAVHRLSVVTRNVDDFIRAEVAVFNPWTGRLIEAGGRSAPADEATRKGAS